MTVATVAVQPPPPGAEGLALVTIGNKSYLYYHDASGNPTGDYALAFEYTGRGIIAIRTNNPCPEFSRAADGRIEVGDV